MNRRTRKGMPDKPMDERTTRLGILEQAKRLGCEGGVKEIFNKYDRLLHSCTNEVERQEIARLAIVELHNYMQCAGNLIVDGEEILPAQKEIQNVGGLIKLD